MFTYRLWIIAIVGAMLWFGPACSSKMTPEKDAMMIRDSSMGEPDIQDAMMIDVATEQDASMERVDTKVKTVGRDKNNAGIIKKKETALKKSKQPSTTKSKSSPIKNKK